MCFLTKYFKALYKGFCIYAKKTEKLFFDVKISCVYRIFYDHEFFCPRQDHIQVSHIFLKDHLTKIAVFGGDDGYPRDFSGNVVDGVLFLGVSCRKLSLNKIGVMNMSYIIDSGQNRLYTTFLNIFHYYRPVWRIYHTSKKNHFHEKITYFWIENVR